jgi:putative redox protein
VNGAVCVEHKEGDLFEVTVRGHLLHVDQPLDAGGTDTAPTPTELFVASLAACVAFYVRRFLARHHLPDAGLSVSARFTMADRPARVGAIHVAIAVPEGLPAQRRAALMAVASRCTVHNSLADAPAVTIELGM